MTPYTTQIDDFVNHLDSEVLSALESCASLKAFKKGDFLYSRIKFVSIVFK